MGGNTKAYCGIKKVPKVRYRGDAVDCKNQIRYWGINEVNKKLLDEFIKNKKQKQEMKQQEKKIKTGGAIDIHKAILKVAPNKGFVMPGP